MLVIDPILDKASGQQTGVSARIEELLGPALLTSIKELTVIEFDGDNVAK